MEINSINRRDAIKKTALFMGYAVSASAVAGVIKGCKADPNAVAEGLKNWTPEFLSEPEGQLVAQISECIIPKTDTPGSIDAGVYSFIDIFLKYNETSEGQTKFKDGLANFELFCKNDFGKPFLDCNNEEKIEALKKEEASAIQKRKTNPSEKTFWFKIKELTFLGFFTSEPGAKQFLKYDPIPGSYEACIPLDEVGGTWY
jgi:glucoside 3-dehydrogenase (cytochrome c) hitch-hiker subunit